MLSTQYITQTPQKTLKFFLFNHVHLLSLNWIYKVLKFFSDKISKSWYGCRVFVIYIFKTLNMKTSIKEDHYVTDTSSESLSETAMANT